MWTKDNWLYIVDAKNQQEEYAQAAKLFECLERFRCNGSVEETEAMDINRVRIGLVPSQASEQATQIRIIETRLKLGNRRKITTMDSWEQMETKLKQGGAARGFCYYLRVDMGGENSDLSSLRYLVLLLQSMPEVRARLAVCFLCEDKQENAYFELSNFLRFVQIRYKLFYTTYGGVYQCLSVKANGTQQTFLPLLEIDTDSYPMLVKPWELEQVYQKEGFDKLFRAIRPRGAAEGDITTVLFQIGARFLFKRMNGYKFQKPEKKKDLLQMLCDVASEAGGVTALDMLLFGALLDSQTQGALDRIQARAYLASVQLFSGAVAQVLENIVYHSEHQKGVFTIRLQTVPGYVGKNYPDCRLEKGKSGFELLIADANRRDGIVQNFLKGAKATGELREHEIRLADFFQAEPKGPAALAWRRARESRPELCHGLLTFACAVQAFGGALRVRSSPAFTGMGSGNYYYRCGSPNEEEVACLEQDLLWMPGTQFSVLFSHSALRKDAQRRQETSAKSVFDTGRILYSASYLDLAHALELQANPLTLFPEGQGLEELSTKFLAECGSLEGQERKDAIVQKWKTWFTVRSKAADGQDGVPHYVLFDADLRNCIVQEGMAQEAFCKGFLTSGFFARTETERNVLCILLLRNMSQRLGEAFYQALSTLLGRIYTMSTCVYFYQENETSGAAPYLGATIQEALHLINPAIPEQMAGFPRVLPYTLLVKDGNEGTLFEQEIVRQAAGSIVSRGRQGYKIENTHMRLGNKVHMDSFFEMALFFENLNHAYYTAFLLLNQLKNIVDIENPQRNILFYGYTSYSKGIVWAAIQIWKQYLQRRGKGGNKVKMEFVIYQNDLKLESTSSSVQMYYSDKKWLQDPSSIWTEQETSLIQVVPISSSLTTFNKMLSRLCEDTGKSFKPEANLTAFWVRDDFHEKSTGSEEWPTEEEQEFWERVDPESRTIYRSMEQDGSGVPIHYLVSVSSLWRSPLNCEKCFPDDPLLEYPLVETDPTSTIPTQQFYLQALERGKNESDKNKLENDRRVAKLKGNMIYGHISRGHNHFQYYVRTRRYFLQERENIARWLESIAEGREQGPQRIDVLVVPKQTSNVEFSQFVYEYYFKCSAESILVNTEKEFRSNFTAEYNGLFQRLKWEREQGRQVRFHYIDMAIDSGTTFNRAAALIRSLFDGDDGMNREENNAGFLFESVFLLVSRMSYDSKRTFVRNPEKQFHAYAELNISNIRTYGDSCVPCKLQQEACLHYRNAATKSVSEYWEEKSIRRADVHFDKRQKTGDAAPCVDGMCGDEDDVNWENCDEGFCRMACTHRAAYYFNPVRGKETAEYFGALRGFLTELLEAVKGGEAVSPVYVACQESPLSWLSAGLKVIVRPFFSFDYKLRCAAMDLYLLLAGRLLDPDGKRPCPEEFAAQGKPHIDGDALEWVWRFADGLERELGVSRDGEGVAERLFRRICFIRSNLLKGLTDLKSNYILRRSTMLLVCQQIAKADLPREKQDEFFAHYLRSVLRLMHSSSDETKSVWLEHLLQFQREYSRLVQPKEAQVDRDSLYREIHNTCPEVLPAFRQFFELLLVENNRPLYQGVYDLDRNAAEKELDRVMTEYYMRNVCRFVNLGEGKEQLDVKLVGRELPALLELYQLLDRGDVAGQKPGKDLGKLDPLDRYHCLCRVLQKVISGEQEALPNESRVLLFGDLKNRRDKVGPPYYIISPRLDMDYTGQAKADDMLGRIDKRLAGQMEELEKNSFLLLKCEEESAVDHEGWAVHFDVVLKLDNNSKAIRGRPGCEEYIIQRIEPVYIFLPCALERRGALMVVRKILMFRCKLIAWLEQDFNNDTIASLSRQRYWAETLSADKVGDHAEHDFIECMQRVLIDEGEDWDSSDHVIAGPDGRGIERAGGDADSLKILKGPSDLELGYLRHWHLLCAYVNYRISRLYRTCIRELNHRENIRDWADSPDQIKEYYARDYHDLGMGPAHNFQDLFFTQVNAGASRKNYITQIMQAVTFTIDGILDTEHGDDLESRLSVVRDRLGRYQCVQHERNGERYAYLSEYLAVIFLDCCVSAIKAGGVWNGYRWGDQAYLDLRELPAREKCAVRLSREAGSPELGFDYLIIENDVCTNREKNPKSEPGMSQRAMQWYVEKLWQFMLGQEQGYPAVECRELEEGTKYRVKLPILKREKE